MARLPVVLRVRGHLDRATVDQIAENWRRAVRQGVAIVDDRIDVTYPRRVRAKHGHTPRWVNGFRP